MLSFLSIKYMQVSDWHTVGGNGCVLVVTKILARLRETEWAKCNQEKKIAWGDLEERDTEIDINYLCYSWLVHERIAGYEKEATTITCQRYLNTRN